MAGGKFYVKALLSVIPEATELKRHALLVEFGLLTWLVYLPEGLAQSYESCLTK